jgi:hypothetical protein
MKIALAAATLAFAMAGFAAAPANADINNHCHPPFHWVVGTGCVHWGVSAAAVGTQHKIPKALPHRTIPVARKAEIFDRWPNGKPKYRSLSKSQPHAGNGGTLAKLQKK